MAEKKHIPQVRFSGFDSEWRNLDLGEIASKISEKNWGNFVTETFTNSAEHGVISQRSFFDHDIAKADKISGYYIIQPNDFVYNPRISVTAPCGPINCNRLEKAGVMSPLYTVFRTHDTNTVYLEWYFKSNYWHRYMYFNGDSGARSDRFSIKNELFFRMPIPLPEETEQEAIGKLLQKFNKHIAYQQSKLEKLQTIRLSMLEKMFPRAEENVPEVRFKGFDGAWERMPASELFAAYVDKGHPELPVLSATQDAGMVIRDKLGKSVFHEVANEVGYKRVLPGQFVIHLRSFQGGFAHSAIEGITSPAYTVFGFKEPEKHDDFFWKYVFMSKQFIKRLETVTYGIRDGRSINYDEFLTLDFLFPTKEEQSLICKYLLNLDSLISMRRQEIDKLQALKKGLLEKMFV